MREELDHLKKELEKESNLIREQVQESGGDQPSIRDIILNKERELEKLIHDLDDKVRFGQKAIDRPGSGAGRAGSFLERTPSQSGSIEDFRAVEFTDRPRSRGRGDLWSRPTDDRRGFQGGRERGFLGSRDMDRWASFVFFLECMPFTVNFNLYTVVVIIDTQKSNISHFLFWNCLLTMTKWVIFLEFCGSLKISDQNFLFLFLWGWGCC